MSAALRNPAAVSSAASSTRAAVAEGRSRESWRTQAQAAPRLWDARSRTAATSSQSAGTPTMTTENHLP